MSQAQLTEVSRKYLAQTYKPLPIVYSHGKGSKFWDFDGNEYLDFTSGLGINVLGHANPQLLEVAHAQLEKGIHSCNFFYNEPQAKLAEKLCTLSGLNKVFFSNSGSEAVETAIKFARRYGNAQNPPRNRIISFNEAWHGRTMATISATASSMCRDGYDPLLPNFDLVPMFDLPAIEATTTEETVAVLMEPVTGHGGIQPAPAGFLEKVRGFCDENNLLLLLDEVQTSLGRCGPFFAYQAANIVPDIVCMAKGLGGGHPIGATVCNSKVAEYVTPGCHGAAFGGNPLSTAVSLKVVEIISQPSFLKELQEKSSFLEQKLREELSQSENVREIRCLGMMVGIDLAVQSKPFASKLLDRGLAVISSYGNLIRLLPPYIVTKDEIKQAVGILKAELEQC